MAMGSSTRTVFRTAHHDDDRSKVRGTVHEVPRHPSQEFVTSITRRRSRFPAGRGLCILSFSVLRYLEPMARVAQRFMRLTHEIAGRKIAWLLGFLVALSLGFGCGHHGRSADSAARSAARSVGTPFAIADLDGDHRPDIAVVELQRGLATRARYSIRLQLTAKPESSISVDGPPGGLDITARDVNGDDAADLVVTTELDARLVAVLVNDGHGNFSVAPPEDYPELRDSCAQFVKVPNAIASDNATLAPTRSNSAGQGEMESKDLNLAAASPLVGAENKLAIQRETHRRLGRSPPAVVISA